MKTLYTLLFSLLFFFTLSSSAHHPAEGIVDEDVYAMIDELVEETPHSSITFDEMGDLIISTNLVEVDLLLVDLVDYTSMLDSADTMTTTVNPDGSVTITIQ